MATNTLQHYASTLKQICFRHATDFSPTAANDLRLTINSNAPLLVEWDGTSLADAAAWQSDQFDFGDGTELWAPWYTVRSALEWTTAPTAQRAVSWFLVPSTSATAGTGNAGGITGSSAAYTGYSGSTLDEAVRQLPPIGAHICASDTFEICEGGRFRPSARYATLLGYNESGQSLFTDADEIHIVLTPLVEQFQDT